MLSKRYSFNENIQSAKVKNRAETINLKKEISRINHQKDEEMAVIKNAQKKLLKKTLKLLSGTVYSIYNQETPEVIMYETHTPGFCYRCNGEQKIPSIPMSIVTVEYDSLRDLVFTDGILDIEKLLVLHLISVHKSETLVPVVDLKWASLYKGTSPAARLLEKSRRVGFLVNRTMMDLLPFYTIEIRDPTVGNKTKAEAIKKQINNKLIHRVLLNENLRKLITTVVAVLHSSNFQKFRRLIQLAHDPNAIKATLNKPHILEFMEFLTEQPIVNSCENFILTPPFKLKTRDLNIITLTETLENLINNLRGNVLQLPKRENRVIGDFTVDAKVIDSGVKTPKYSVIMSSNDTSNDVRYPTLSISSDLFKNSTEEEISSQERRRSSRGLDVPNFVSKNIKAAAKTKKIEYDIEEDLVIPSTSTFRRSTLSNSTFRSRSASNSLPVFAAKPSDGVLEERPQSSENTFEKENASNLPSSARVSIASNRTQSITDQKQPSIVLLKPSDMLEYKENKHKHSTFGTGYGKYNIKMTTCKACMEKWRQPLPTPKIPRVKKSNVLPGLEKQALKTDSRHRIDMLINKELYVLESYDRKFSSSSSKNKTLLKKEQPTDSFDNININPMYLAKIEQEIRVKETQKKLEKFLNEPI